MKLQARLFPNLVQIDKPAGFSVSAQGIDKPGLSEIIGQSLEFPLLPIQEMAKELTGVLIFARSEDTALKFKELFQSGQVQKKYLFVTDRKSSHDEYQVQSPVKGQRSQTLFRRVKRSPFFELWEALLSTEAKDQVSIHAAELDLNILGDPLHGGTSFPHLCLHLQSLQLPGSELLTSFPPLFFERLGSLRDLELVTWLSEIDRRQRLYEILGSPEQCLRLMHLEHLRLDQFGQQLWFYWYLDQPPSELDLERCAYVARILKREWLLRKMQDRGSNPSEKRIWHSEQWQTRWLAEENQLRYQFSSEQGQSPGLFLDQRANRFQVRKVSANNKVLNLFSYTCGFSLNAAAGGASEVVSVDLSGPFLEWGKQNFILNNQDASQYEFYKQESLLFLKGAVRRKRQFDLIICDPPSFGRHKDGVFRLDQDLEDLLQLIWLCLKKGGSLLLSCNLEKWSFEELQKKVQVALKNAKVKPGQQEWDFETPGQSPLMKSLWITRT